MNKRIPICALLLLFFLPTPKTYGQDLDLKYEFLFDLTATLGGVTYKIYAIK